MSKYTHLRQGGNFPGGLVNALDDLDARISALEAHAPMLTDMKPVWDEHMAAVQAAAEHSDGPGIEVHIPHHPGEAPHAGTPEAPVQFPEPQQEPTEGSQGGQS